MADATPRLGMASRHMDHVDGDRDDKTRRDSALRDLDMNQETSFIQYTSMKM